MNLPNEPGIYAIVNQKSGKFYIGSAVSMRRRGQQHAHLLRVGKHHCIHLQRAWDKWGARSMSFCVVERVPDLTQLVEKEQAWLDLSGRNALYNIALVAGSNIGVPGPKHTSETIEIIRQSQLGNTHAKGTKHSKKTRRLMSAAARGNKRRLGHKNGEHQKETVRAWHLGRKKRPQTSEEKELKRKKNIAFCNSPEGLAMRARTSARLKERWASLGHM